MGKKKSWTGTILGTVFFLIGSAGFLYFLKYGTLPHYFPIKGILQENYHYMFESLRPGR